MMDYPPGDLYASKGAMVLEIIIAFPIIAFIILLMRLYTRIRLVNLIAIDDWLIVISMIFSIATSICMGFQVHYGMGRHVQTLTPEMAMGSLKALFWSITMYNFSLTFTKLSILCQYLRICVSKPVRMACLILVAITIGNGVQTLLSNIWTCTPVKAFWELELPPGHHCVDKSALWFANAGINITQDIALILIPLFLIKDLMLPRRQKVFLMLILAVGGFTAVTSVLRLHAVYVVSISKDISWDNPGTATWSCIELNTGIVCASLATLRPLLSRYFPSFLSTHRKHPAGYQYGSKDRRSNAIHLADPASHGYFSSTSKDLEAGDDFAELKDIEKLAAGAGSTIPRKKTVEAFVQANPRPSDFSSANSTNGDLSPSHEKQSATPFGIKVVTTTRQFVEYDGSEHSPDGRRESAGGNDTETDSQKHLVLDRK